MHDEDAQIVVRESVVSVRQDEPRASNAVVDVEFNGSIGCEERREAGFSHRRGIGGSWNVGLVRWTVKSDGGVRIVFKVWIDGKKHGIDARGTPRTVDWVVVDALRRVHHQRVLLIAIHGTHAVGRLLQLDVKAVHGHFAFGRCGGRFYPKGVGHGTL